MGGGGAGTLKQVGAVITALPAKVSQLLSYLTLFKAPKSKLNEAGAGEGKGIVTLLSMAFLSFLKCIL